MKNALKELAIGIGLVLVMAVFLGLSGAAVACCMQFTGAWSG